MVMKNKLVISFLVISFLGFSHLFFNQVSTEISDNDLIAINKIQNKLDCDDLNNFRGELWLIQYKAILFISPTMNAQQRVPLKGQR